MTDFVIAIVWGAIVMAGVVKICKCERERSDERRLPFSAVQKIVMRAKGVNA